MQILAVPANATKAWLLAQAQTETAIHADPRDCSWVSLLQDGAALTEFVPGSETPDAVILVPDHNHPLFLRVIVDLLLGPHGCPWDREQTHASLTKYLIEESYEFIQAVQDDSQPAMVEELGDVFLQPFLHTQIAEKAGTFKLADALSAISSKLIRRHPHVFADVSVSGSDEVLKNWDQIKKKEKGESGSASILGDVPIAMPSLSRALAISKRAARAGFEWPNKQEVLAKLQEEIAEYEEAVLTADSEHIQSEIGDVLFTVVNIARWEKVDPEEALRKMLTRFTDRFHAMEASTKTPLSELTPAEWDRLWVAAKAKLSK